MLFDTHKHRLIAQSSLPEYAGDADIGAPYYIPARWAVLATLMPDTTIVLPDHPTVRAHVAFLAQTLAGRGKLSAIWSPDKNYLLDTDIAEHLIPTLCDLVQTYLAQGKGTTVVPYQANKECLAWTTQLPGVDVLGDTKSFMKQCGHKGILHPHIQHPNKPGLLQESGIRVARGYSCDTKADLLLAFARLQSIGVGSMIIKPVLGSTGEGIQKVRTEAEIGAYQWNHEGGFVLEECLPLDSDDSGLGEVNCSVQFMGSTLLGQPTTQMVEGAHWIGNVTPSVASVDFQSDVQKQAKSALATLAKHGHVGPGGFDFVSAAGKAYLIDPNVGRYTGAHIPKYLAELLAPDRAWCSLEMPHQLSVEAAWEILQRKGLAFDANKKAGVYPFCHLEAMWSMHVAYAEDSRAAVRLIMNAKEALS